MSDADTYPDEHYPVVLTPGFLDDERKFSWLATSMRAYGLQPVIISPQPSDGRVSIRTLATQLAEGIHAQFGPDQPVDFMGFSMGGLIGRYFVQRLGGARRVARFVTMATPHRGTVVARFMPSSLPALVEMRPGSKFLEELNQDADMLRQHDFMAFWTPFDLTATPPHHCYLPELPSTRIYSPFHATLLHDPIVMRLVSRAFLAPRLELSTV
jgi:triacylglycerol lipase